MTLQTAAPPAARTGTRDRLVAALMLAVMGLELLSRASGWEGPRFAVFAAMLALVPAALPRLGLREAYLLSLSAMLTGLILWLHPAPFAAVTAAFDQAAFLMAFILLLSLLQETATTSVAIARCGEWLTRQPAGRRYVSINLGSNFMGVLFNLGVVSLLAPLIRRGVEQGAPGDPLNPIRERRQLSAMLRGFAWCAIWSPTALAPLALMELLHGVDRPRWIAIGFVVMLIVTLLGWAEDQYAWRGFRGRARLAAPPPFPARAALDFFVVCLCLLAITVAAMTLMGETVVLGLMIACPILSLGWLWSQNGAWSGASARMRGIVRDGLPLSAPVAITLACSGYVGRAAATLVPAEQLAAAMGLADLPGYVFLTGAAVAVAVLSQFALSPIMMAVFFGAFLGALPSLPADPTLTALAISCGWALSMTISPFATVVLVTARITGHSGREMTWFWNLRFTLAAVVLLLAVFWVLTGGA
jgi:hypothetical protein